MKQQKPEIFLPRFKPESGYDLNDSLVKMDKPDAFGPKAEFSGIDGTKFVPVAESFSQQKLHQLEPFPAAFHRDGLNESRNLDASGALATIDLQLAIEASPSKLPGVTLYYETGIMDDASGPDPKTRITDEKPTLFERRMLLTVYQQNWENARHIKNERLSFTNIYCIVAAGMLSLLHTVAGKRALEISMLFFLVLFSFIGLLTSLRLKAELEECLHKIDQIVLQTGVGPISALSEAKGVPTRYPKFRWIFPWFYSIGTIGFLILLWQRVLER